MISYFDVLLTLFSVFISTVQIDFLFYVFAIILSCVIIYDIFIYIRIVCCFSASLFWYLIFRILILWTLIKSRFILIIFRFWCINGLFVTIHFLLNTCIRRLITIGGSLIIICCWLCILGFIVFFLDRIRFVRVSISSIFFRFWYKFIFLRVWIIYSFAWFVIIEFRLLV